MLLQVLDFFVTSAHADSLGAMPGQQGGSSGMSFLLMFVVLILFIYFTIWRPQNKQATEQARLLNSLTKGDEVMTAGGLMGRINKMNDQYISLAISENSEIVVQKSSVVSLLPKGTMKSLEFK